MRGRVFTAIMLSFVSISQAREPRLGTLTTYSMPGYTLVSQDERMARRLINQLPACQAVLAKIFNQVPQTPVTPTRIWIASRHVFERYLHPDGFVTSAFAATPPANYLLFDASVTPERESYDICAEISRLHVQTQFRGTTPAWFRQGLSTLMYLTDIEASEAFIGRRGSITHYKWIPFEQLLRLDETQLGRLRSGERFYMYDSESWALVHRGLLGDSEFGKQMFAYMKAVDAGDAVDLAVESSFGMSVAELDRSMHEYLGNPKFRVAVVEFEAPSRLTLPPGRVLAKGEALELLATAMLDTRLNPRHLDEVIDAAEKHSPDSAAVQNLRRRFAGAPRNQ